MNITWALIVKLEIRLRRKPLVFEKEERNR